MSRESLKAILSLPADQIGIAYLIDQRSPGRSAGQLAWFSRVEAKRETFGRLGQTSAKTVNRARVSIESDDLTDDSDHVDTIARNDLATAVAQALGDLGAALLKTGSVDAAADLCGMSRATAYRRIADVRRRFAALVAE
jgi:hypothetical protein